MSRQRSTLDCGDWMISVDEDTVRISLFNEGHYVEDIIVTKDLFNNDKKMDGIKGIIYAQI